MPPGMLGACLPECRTACPRNAEGHAARHTGRHAWRRSDSVDQRSYLMFIMLITCQSLFKKDDKVVACIAGAGFLMIAGAVQFQRRRHRKGTVGEKPWIQVRPLRGVHSSLISDLRNTDESAFQNYLRINVAAFEDLMSRVEHVIVKQRTRWRATICRVIIISGMERNGRTHCDWPVDGIGDR